MIVQGKKHQVSIVISFGFQFDYTTYIKSSQFKNTSTLIKKTNIKLRLIKSVKYPNKMGYRNFSKGFKISFI